MASRISPLKRPLLALASPVVVPKILRRNRIFIATNPPDLDPDHGLRKPAARSVCSHHRIAAAGISPGGGPP